MADLDLPGIANPDQETHISDHNKIRQALIDINDEITTKVLRIMYSQPITWTNMPAADTLLQGTAYYMTLVDLTGYTKVRMWFNVTTIGAAGSKLMLRYASAWSNAVGSYSTIGVTEVQCSLISAGSLQESGWVNLVPGAIGPVTIAVVGTAGNGAADPTFGSITVEFAT